LGKAEFDPHHRLQRRAIRRIQIDRHRDDLKKNAAQAGLPWQCLYFLPEPQGQGSLRPTFSPRTNGACFGALTATAASSASAPTSASPQLGGWYGTFSAAGALRSSASACACCSSVWSCKRIRMRVVSILTVSRKVPNNAKASRLYSCFGFFCA